MESDCRVEAQTSTSVTSTLPLSILPPARLHALCQLPFAAASSDLIFSWFVVANSCGGTQQGVQTGVGEANWRHCSQFSCIGSLTGPFRKWRQSVLGSLKRVFLRRTPPSAATLFIAWMCYTKMLRMNFMCVTESWRQHHHRKRTFANWRGSRGRLPQHRVFYIN